MSRAFCIYSLAQSVKLMIALAIFLTYALQFYVPMEIIWKNVRHKFSEDNKNAAEWTIRYMLVVSEPSSAAQNVNRFCHFDFFHFTDSNSCHCCGDSSARSVHWLDWCCVSEYIGPNVSIDHRNCHLLRETRLWPIQLDSVEKYFADLLRNHRFLHRNLCQYTGNCRWIRKIVRLVNR